MFQFYYLQESKSSVHSKMDTRTFNMSFQNNMQFEDGIYDLTEVTTEHTEYAYILQFYISAIAPEN